MQKTNSLIQENMNNHSTSVIISRQYNDWNKLSGLSKFFRRAIFFMNQLNILPSQKCRVEVLLSDDNTLHELNNNFRKKNKATDVLSFADGSIHNRILFLGEIAISWQQVQGQAISMKLKNEIQNIELSNIPSIEAIIERSIHLFIHGFLHLLNHEHSTNTGAKKMEFLEISIMNSLGYENPYAY